MKKVFKYGTGDGIPEGAIYLSTQVETDLKYYYDNPDTSRPDWVITKNKLVWHYFLVNDGPKELHPVPAPRPTERMG